MKTRWAKWSSFGRKGKLIVKILISFAVSLMAIMPSWPAHSQTDAIPASSSVTNNAPASQDQVLPKIEFVDTPVTTVIDTLARVAGINYILDPKLFQTNEPILTFRLKNLSARETLNRLLNLRGLVLNEDSLTHIARITRIGEPTNTMTTDLLAMETNNLAFFTNDMLPNIVFEEVPLDSGLNTLVRASGGKIVFDPGLEKSGNGQFVEDNGVAVSNPKTKANNLSVNERFNPMPVVTVHWTNVSPLQALIALCENYDLAIIKNETNNILQIKLKDDQSQH